jgi:TonB-dependent SusC/RagA subfamily outer membrane receptor
LYQRSIKSISPMKRLLVITTVCALLLSACATSSSTSQKNAYDSDEQAKNVSEVGSVSSVDVKQNHLDLATYLRKIPGISVRGSGNDVSVFVRGTSSATQQQEPLYVINTSPVGNSYQQANNSVDVNDISNVTVLKDVASTNQYGMRGANGVIVIRTKRK